MSCRLRVLPGLRLNHFVDHADRVMMDRCDCCDLMRHSVATLQGENLALRAELGRVKHLTVVCAELEAEVNRADEAAEVSNERLNELRRALSAAEARCEVLEMRLEDAMQVRRSNAVPFAAATEVLERHSHARVLQRYMSHWLFIIKLRRFGSSPSI